MALTWTPKELNYSEQVVLTKIQQSCYEQVLWSLGKHYEYMYKMFH